MENTISDINRPRIYRTGLILFLIMFVHLKFFVQIILDMNVVLFDILLYVLLLACIDYRHIRYSLLVLLPIAMVSLLNPAARNIFVIFLLTYIISNLPFKTILRYNIISQILVFLLASICLYLGITQSVLFQQTVLDSRIRYDYGMGNPNTFALFTYSAIINMYLYYGIRNKYVMWIILMVTLAVAEYTGSRTFLVAVIMLLLFNFMRGRLIKWNKLSKVTMFVMPIILFAVIFYFSINYVQYPAVNLLFTGRLELYNSLISSVPITQLVIGSPLINEMTIDNSYLHIIYEGGVIPFAIFLYLYYNSIFKSSASDISILLPLFVSVFMVGLTESVLTFTLIFGNMIIWVIMYKIYLGESLSTMLKIPRL